MWVYKNENGKYKFFERYIHPVSGEEYKPSVTLLKNNRNSRKQAKLILDEKFKEWCNHSNNTMTFADAVNDWLEFIKPSLKQSTFENRKSRFVTINKDIGKFRLDKLRVYDINKYLQKSLKRLKYRTVANDKSMICQVLEYCANNQLIEQLPYRQMIVLPKINTEKEKNDLKYLERDELEQVYDQLKEMPGDYLVNLVKFQVATGMRFNEIMAINYKRDIDFKKKTIHIQSNYDPRNHVFTSPKTDDDRTIYVTDELLDICREQITRSKLIIVKNGLDRNIHNLFIGRNGNPVNVRDINKKLAKVNIEDKKISTHIFRHTFITLMVEAKVDRELIARHVGHSSTKMIDKVYSHFTNKMGEELHQAIMNNKII